MKIAHLHIKDSFGNPKTLICRLENGSIYYKYWIGLGDSGMGYDTSGMNLPIEKAHKNETKEEFVQRLISILNRQNYKVIHQVEEVSF